MKATIKSLTAVLCLLAISGAALAADAPTKSDKPESVYKKTLRGTALVQSDAGNGTGWVVSRDKKLLVTCQHVVGEAARVSVYFPSYRGNRVIENRTFYADAKPVMGRIVAVNAPHDLALVELESVPEGVAELKLAPESPEPGEDVHAVGCPGSGAGLWVYSYGKVRQVTDARWSYSDGKPRAARVVETQIPVNPGDSGGPLVNDRAEVIGVNAGNKPGAQLASMSVEIGEVRKLLEAPRSLPKKADDHVKAALAHKAKKAWRLAAEELAKALDLEPKHGRALTELAYIFNEVGKHEEALTVSFLAVADNSKNAAGWREMGYALLKKRDAKRALEALKKAVALDPEDRDAKLYLEAARKIVEDGDRTDDDDE